MKSRTIRLLESPDTPYITRQMRKASEEHREPTLPQYMTSLTPPPFASKLAPESPTERNLARAETALEDVARREQVLAAQVQAYRHSVAEMAEERALFEAEQINHAKKVTLAEEALIRMRKQLVLEGRSSEGKGRSHETHRAADEEPPQIETEGFRSPQDSQGAVELAKVGNSAPEVGQLLSRLAKQAADFAALAETVTELQRQLAEERTRHEATARSQMDELHGRESALAQRESEAGQRISDTTVQLNGDRESLARAQEKFAAAKRELAELQLKLTATETKQRDDCLALESKVAALDARETALEEKRLVFDERLRKFRENFSSFMED